MDNQDRPARRAGYGVASLVAAGTFLLAYRSGSYAVDTTTAVGVGVWWAVLVAVVVVGRGPRWTAASVLAIALFGAFTGWTLASVVWADSAEAAYFGFARTALYLGLLLLVLLLVRRKLAGYWADGLAAGIVAVSLLALASRFFPDAIGSSAGIRYLPALRSRLSYPIGYWNGLGILAAIGLPLVVGSVMRASTPRRAGVCLAGAPLLGTVMYLTSSRGAFATAVVGAVALVALSRRRLAAVGAIALGTCASALAILAVGTRDAFANGVPGAAATHEGRVAAVLVVVICALTTIAYPVLSQLPQPSWRPSRTTGWFGATVAALVIIASAFAAHPIRRLDDFKRPPPALSAPSSDVVRAHLLSGSSSGRWQFWGAAITEFESRPVIGRGGGSYEEWWAQHGTLATSIQDAHSLYLQTLAELGLIGLALLAGFVASAVAIVIGSTRADDDDGSSSTAASAGAAFVAFLVGAAIDWLWQLPAITAVAVASLGIVMVLVPAHATARSLPRAARLSIRSAVVVTALCLAVAELIPLLAEVRIGQSQRAASRGETNIALAAARAAIRVQPWAATPYLQLALVDEQAGSLSSARSAIGQALVRDGRSWQLALVAARLETELGDIAAARRSYLRARSLDPRSPLFAIKSS